MREITITIEFNEKKDDMIGNLKPYKDPLVFKQYHNIIKAFDEDEIEKKCLTVAIERLKIDLIMKGKIEDDKKTI